MDVKWVGEGERAWDGQLKGGGWVSLRAQGVVLFEKRVVVMHNMNYFGELH